jgi:hypothetical protein
MDIATIAELGTAVGTAILGVATFGATRSANRSARIAERALLLGLRPVLSHARPEDADQDVIFGDGRTVRVRGGHGVVELADGVVYLAIPLRNVGAGLAVLQRYDLLTRTPVEEAEHSRSHLLHDRSERRHGPIADFRPQQRDLYIAPGDTGYWQAALRDADADAALRAAMTATIEAPQPFSVDLLYGDHEGGQHAISRFNLVPEGDGDWLCTVVFHWTLESADPREG